MNMASPDIRSQIDTDIAARFLREITQGWDQLQEAVSLEIRCLFPNRTTQVARFSPDNGDIARAVSHAADMNNTGLNVYAVINPVREENQMTGKAASDKDIVAAFWQWADSDDEASANALREFAGPRPNMVVLTGRTPFARPHAYWRIEDGPVTDLAAWRRVQEGIAATFGSDRVVVNPSRIMRVPGFVNWPTRDKAEKKGRVPEIATLAVFDERAPVSFKRLTRTFGDAVPKTMAANNSAGFEIEPLTQRLDSERMRIRALSGEEWHNSVVRLVGSYVSRGLSDDEIHALTDPLTLTGYTVEQTRAEVQKAIDGARAKGWTPEIKTFDPPAAIASASPDETEPSWPTLLSNFDESSLPRRRWIYGYDYIRGFVSVVASAGGVGKTSQAIVEGLAIVTNRPLLGVAVKEQAKVWIVNLEDPREELEMRTLAAMRHYGIKPEDVRGKLFLDGEDTIQITLAMEGRDGLQINEALVSLMRDKIIENDIGVVMIDPFISTHQVNENSNASIQAVVALLRGLARATDTSISIIHHIRKGNGEEATVDAVRGAGSLIGAARAVRVINRISERTAIELGIRPDQAKGIFRVDDGKANLAPPAEKAVYRQMIGVQLENGEWVGVATRFELPDEWAGMDEETCNRILAKIALGPDEDSNTEEYYSARPQDKKRWVGNVILSWPFRNADHTKTPAQAKKIIQKWIETGLLEEVEYFSAAQRKERKGLAVCGYVGEQK